MLKTFTFYFNSVLFGTGLAMDAFSVSLANGLNEPKMKKRKMLLVAGVFALFQFLMPMLGWVCVHTVSEYFTDLQKYIPWIALILLLFIGGKMLIEGIRDDGVTERPSVGLAALLVQGIATSIDALSVGFTIAAYSLLEAAVSCLIIGITTYIICAIGLVLGKKFGTKFAGKAGILGGAILIFIGIEIFVTGVF